MEAHAETTDPNTGLDSLSEGVPTISDHANQLLEPGQAGLFWDVDLGRYLHFVKPLHLGALITTVAAIVQVIAVTLGIDLGIDLSSMGGAS